MATPINSLKEFKKRGKKSVIVLIATLFAIMTPPMVLADHTPHFDLQVTEFIRSYGMTLRVCDDGNYPSLENVRVSGDGERDGTIGRDVTGNVSLSADFNIRACDDSVVSLSLNLNDVSLKWEHQTARMVYEGETSLISGTLTTPGGARVPIDSGAWSATVRIASRRDETSYIFIRPDWSISNEVNLNVSQVSIGFLSLWFYVDNHLPGDINKDGNVDATDLNYIITSWGATGNNLADINKDGKVGTADLNILALNWMKTWGS
ncbi:hypothetical protein BVX98_04755 [bacterium F11]|nr:hypothetical protein BVX98_04755 [bacterium F11]